MEGRVKRHAGFIKKFYKCNAKNCKNLVKRASDEQIRTLCECALNVYKGNVPLKTKYLRRLREHKASLKRLGFTKANVGNKRKFLVQNGGFLPSLAAAVIPLLAGLLIK
jgi:predicted metalloprotease